MLFRFMLVEVVIDICFDGTLSEISTYVSFSVRED